MDAKFHILSTQGAGLRVRELRRRTHHAKDTHGCLSCRQKRVKCDQHRPICLRCTRNMRECVYIESPSISQASNTGVTTTADHGLVPHQQSQFLPLASLSLMQPNAAALATIVAEANSEALSPWIKEHGTSVHNLLHHFSTNSATIIGQPLDAKFWDLACRNNFLVSTMLAVSACHLRHHTPDPAPHYIAELGQESVAISVLKSAIALPLHKEHADALLFTAVMLNAITFAFVESHVPSTSWVFSNSPDRLGWLDLQLQFKKLEEVTSQFRDSSLLPPTVNETDGQAPQSDDAEDITFDQLPAAWKMLIAGKDTLNYRVCQKPLIALAKLKFLEPNCHNSFAYFDLIKQLEGGFRNLLFEKDPPALWIFGYWLGLLGRLDIWWCSPRVKRDWAAVLNFLREKELAQRPGGEGGMWQSLINDLSLASKWPLPHTENVL